MERNSLITAYQVFSCTIAFCTWEIPSGNWLAETTCHAMPFVPGFMPLRAPDIDWPTGPPSKSWNACQHEIESKKHDRRRLTTIHPGRAWCGVLHKDPQYIEKTAKMTTASAPTPPKSVFR
jgi:hypothetical protein